MRGCGGRNVETCETFVVEAAGVPIRSTDLSRATATTTIRYPCPVTTACHHTNDGVRPPSRPKKPPRDHRGGQTCSPLSSGTRCAASCRRGGFVLDLAIVAGPLPCSAPAFGNRARTQELGTKAKLAISIASPNVIMPRQMAMPMCSGMARARTMPARLPGPDESRVRKFPKNRDVRHQVDQPGPIGHPGHVERLVFHIAQRHPQRRAIPPGGPGELGHAGEQIDDAMWIWIKRIARLAVQLARIGSGPPARRWASQRSSENASPAGPTARYIASMTLI